MAASISDSSDMALHERALMPGHGLEHCSRRLERDAADEMDLAWRAPSFLPSLASKPGARSRPFLRKPPSDILCDVLKLASAVNRSLPRMSLGLRRAYAAMGIRCTASAAISRLACPPVVRFISRM